MTFDQKPLNFAIFSVTTVACLGLWCWAVDPSQPARWIWPIFFLPAFWGFIELKLDSPVPGRETLAILGFHRWLIAGVGLIIAISLGFKLVISIGLLDPDWSPMARRVKGLLWAAGCMVWGNYLPKLLSPWRPEDEPFDWQRVHRFVGWLFSMAGIALAAVWMTFPLEDAKIAATSVMITICVLGLGRKMFSVFEHSRRQPPPALHQEADDSV